MVILSKTHGYLFWLVAKAKREEVVFEEMEDVLCVKS
jgi:hypothetical protein